MNPQIFKPCVSFTVKDKVTIMYECIYRALGAVNPMVLWKAMLAVVWKTGFCINQSNSPRPVTCHVTPHLGHVRWNAPVSMVTKPVTMATGTTTMVISSWMVTMEEAKVARPLQAWQLRGEVKVAVYYRLTYSYLTLARKSKLGGGQGYTMLFIPYYKCSILTNMPIAYLPRPASFSFGDCIFWLISAPFSFIFGAFSALFFYIFLPSKRNFLA